MNDSLRQRPSRRREEGVSPLVAHYLPESAAAKGMYITEALAALLRVRLAYNPPRTSCPSPTSCPLPRLTMLCCSRQPARNLRPPFPPGFEHEQTAKLGLIVNSTNF